MRSEVAVETVAWLKTLFDGCLSLEGVDGLGQRIKRDIERGYEWTLCEESVAEVRRMWKDARARIRIERADDQQADHGVGVVHSEQGVPGESA